MSPKSMPTSPIVWKSGKPCLAGGPRLPSASPGFAERRAPRGELVKAGKAGVIRNCRWSCIFCLVLLVGCGYQMVGKETHVPPGLSSIAIPTFKNQTFEPGIEILFTQAFLNEFIQDRRVKVVTRKEADSILEGVVRQFAISSVAYDNSGFVAQYQILVWADFALKDRTGKVLWVEKDVRETGWFRAPPVGVTSGNTGTSGITNEAAKQATIQKTAGFMAERIRNRFFYDF